MTKAKVHNEAQRRPEAISRWEVAFGTLGLLVVLFALGYLTWDGLKHRGTPPRIVLSVEGTAPSPGGFLVEFTANNRGDVAALSVEIEGTLSEAGTVRDHARVVLEDVPSGSERRGGLYFRQNPSHYTLQLRALGYRQP